MITLKKPVEKKSWCDHIRRQTLPYDYYVYFVNWVKGDLNVDEDGEDWLFCPICGVPKPDDGVGE